MIYVRFDLVGQLRNAVMILAGLVGLLSGCSQEMQVDHASKCASGQSAGSAAHGASSTRSSPVEPSRPWGKTAHTELMLAVRDVLERMPDDYLQAELLRLSTADPAKLTPLDSIMTGELIRLLCARRKQGELVQLLAGQFPAQICSCRTEAELALRWEDKAVEIMVAAYRSSQRPDTRQAIARALQKAFPDAVVEGAGDDQAVAAADAWYRANRHSLIRCELYGSMGVDRMLSRGLFVRHPGATPPPEQDRPGARRSSWD